MWVQFLSATVCLSNLSCFLTNVYVLFSSCVVVRVIWLAVYVSQLYGCVLSNWLCVWFPQIYLVWLCVLPIWLCCCFPVVGVVTPFVVCVCVCCYTIICIFCYSVVLSLVLWPDILVVFCYPILIYI